jgi:hypothetical protein
VASGGDIYRLGVFNSIVQRRDRATWSETGPSGGGTSRVPTGGLTPRAKTYGGYHPGLALRQNDPSAWVDGPRSLQKLVDERKRKGYTTFEP